MIHAFYRICLLSTSPLVLTACSVSEKDQVQEQELFPTSHEFSAEDKRVARVLSLGNEIARDNSTPQYKAVLCTLALAEIKDRMGESNLMSSQQSEAFAKVQNVYRRRASVGLSGQEREKLRSDVEADHPEQRERARFAIGCLRDLA